MSDSQHISHLMRLKVLWWLFAVQVRKVVMDTMKNIHPIYNIKVGQSVAKLLAGAAAVALHSLTLSFILSHKQQITQRHTCNTVRKAEAWAYCRPVLPYSSFLLYFWNLIFFCMAVDISEMQLPSDWCVNGLLIYSYPKALKKTQCHMQRNLFTRVMYSRC